MGREGKEEGYYLISRAVGKVSLASMLLAILLLSSMVGLAALIKPVAAAPESLTCSPTSGYVFTSVDLEGVGWGYLATVRIYFNSTQRGVFEYIRDVTTNATGGFKVTVSVPPVVSGEYTWYAVEPGTQRAAKADFTVKEGINLDRNKGPVGKIVRVYGSANEWESSKKVCIIFDKDNNTQLNAGEILTTVTSTANGVIDVYVVVPDVKSGSYYFYANKTSINIEDDLPRNCYNASFTVESPIITISPSSGPVCSSVMVSGNYFKINYLVNITLMRDTTVKSLLATNVPTNATGGFQTTVTIPYCTKADTYEINATDGINSAAESFTVRSPSITVSRSSAMVGETITVEGQNFAIQRDVTIYFSIKRTGARYELIPVKTVTTNATGGFRATVIVPEVPNDNHTDIVEVNVTDGCNYETQDFDVIPSIRISPVRGTPGDTVEVTGTGFRNQTTVTIYFDDQEVATTSTNEYGSFTARFTVPSVPDGLYTVTATDAVNNYATADFQVIAVEFKMILDAIDELERKLDYIKPKIDALTEKIETIGSCINAIIYRMGGFYGEDTVASLLYSIEAKLDALPDAIGSAKAEILDAIQGISLDLTPVLDAIGSAKAEILDAIATVEAKLGALEDIMGKLDEIPKKDWWDLVHLANFRRMVQFVAGSYSTTMPTSDNPVDLERGSKVTLTVRVADDETAGFVIRVYINDGTSWQPLSFSVPGIANADCAATVVFTTGANGDFYFEVDGATFIAYIYSAEFPPV